MANIFLTLPPRNAKPEAHRSMPFRRSQPETMNYLVGCTLVFQIIPYISRCKLRDCTNLMNQPNFQMN